MKPETSISNKNINSDSEFENYKIDIPFSMLRRAHNRFMIWFDLKEKNSYSNFYHFNNTGFSLVFWTMNTKNKLNVFRVSCKLSWVFNIIPLSNKTVQFIKQSGILSYLMYFVLYIVFKKLTTNNPWKDICKWNL